MVVGIDQVGHAATEHVVQGRGPKEDGSVMLTAEPAKRIAMDFSRFLEDPDDIGHAIGHIALHHEVSPVLQGSIATRRQTPQEDSLLWHREMKYRRKLNEVLKGLGVLGAFPRGFVDGRPGRSGGPV